VNLCIDIGNSRIKIGIFEEGHLVRHDVFDTMSNQDMADILGHYPIRRAISSSTRIVETEFEKRVQTQISYMKLDHTTPLPISNAYDTPETLGKDRVAGIVGSQKLFPNENCIVIDAGTCITYDVIVDNTYLGGNISPGLHMRAEAMDKFTSALPLVEPKFHENYIGKSTEMAMQNGIVHGTIFEIDSFISKVKADFSDINVIITGGNAQFFADILKSKIFVHSNLVLDGLDVILNYNAA